MYFEDFPVGYSFTTDHYLVLKDEIIDFAQQWDPQPFHIDEAAAEDYPYGVDCQWLAYLADFFSAHA